MNIMLVFGGRNRCLHGSREYVAALRRLDEIANSFFGPVNVGGVDKKRFTVMSGGAPGVDSMAMEWAARRELDAMRIPARWNEEQRAAGPRRNRRMMRLALELRGEKGDYLVCVKFPGGPGTRDMEVVCREQYELHGGMNGAMWIVEA